MPSVISASTASNTALNFSADTSGVLEIRTGSSPTTALTIDASQNATFANVINGNGSGITSINAANVSSGVLAQARGGTGTTTGYYGFKNRIINGAMVIDQRNAGASVTPTTDGLYSLDRWQYSISQASKFSIQQDAGAVTPPAGFTDYLGVTSLSAYSVVASDLFVIQQNIEGFNVADLGWGTANAKTVTLSFWVRSSLTGTFGGSLRNNASDRSYPYSYTISAANTWEYKTVTIAGDTTGTWLTTNGTGLRVTFSLGMGSTRSGTAGAWAAGSFWSATGATSVVGTNGATFYITGVQLEVGSTATSFDYRPYGTELALAQRYFENSNGSGGLSASSDPYVVVTTVVGRYPTFTFKISKRIAPTLTASFSGGTGATFAIANSAFYQSSNHSTDSTFGWTASAEL